MRWLGRLRRQKDGLIPSRPSRLGQIAPNEFVDLEALVMHHNLSVRAIESLQITVAELVGQDRDMIGRIDALEGNPNSTVGDPIEIHRERFESLSR